LRISWLGSVQEFLANLKKPCITEAFKIAPGIEKSLDGGVLGRVNVVQYREGRSESRILIKSDESPERLSPLPGTF
jgi:hypothetical protein